MRRNKTIRRQIQAAIIVISMLSMLILGGSVYFISTKNLEKNYKEDFSYNLKTSDNMMNIQTDNIVELMRNLLTNSNYLSTLQKASGNEADHFTTPEIRVFEKADSEIALQSKYVQDILCFSLDGKLSIHSKKSDISQYAALYNMENFEEQKWVKTAVSNKGKESVYGQNILTGKDDTISLTKYMINPVDGSGAGYLVINVSKKMLDEAFANHGAYETNCFMILDKNNDNSIVYFQGADEVGEEIYREYIENGDQSGSYVFAKREGRVDGWELVSGIQKDELNRQKQNIALLIVGFMVLLVAVGVAVAAAISRRIYEPLEKLEQTMQKVEEGERHITEQFDDSDVGRIGNKFKGMVNNNLVLRERLIYTKLRQREQELFLLQERINPHFLYNTLDALYCMAEINGVDDIAKMVEALSETFRLSLNKGNNLICVRDEIKHIEAYMTIQNMRFNNRFKLEIQIDGIEEVQILKLILEPFVENAICHGLEPKLGNGKVTLSGERKENGDILFVIPDDGVGVKDMSILEKGYGIRNVKERIQLYYGKEYGIEFESAEGMGTKVSVRISEMGMGLLHEEETIGNN